MLDFTEVWWLSRENVLNRFFEMKALMEKDGMAVRGLNDPKMVQGLSSPW